MSKLRLAQYGGYIFIVRTAMTPTQIKIVQDSFKRIAPQALQASSIFYDELFRLSSELRQLFPDDMAQHKLKFMQMLSIIIRALDKVDAVSQEVVELGRRHMSYDVVDEHYDAVGEALLAMLSRLLGSEYTTEIKDAWTAAYDMIARVMQEAAVVPQTAEGFFGCVIRSVIASQYGVSTAAGVDAKAAISRNVERAQVLRFP